MWKRQNRSSSAWQRNTACTLLVHVERVPRALSCDVPSDSWTTVSLLHPPAPVTSSAPPLPPELPELFMTSSQKRLPRARLVWDLLTLVDLPETPCGLLLLGPEVGGVTDALYHLNLRSRDHCLSSLEMVVGLTPSGSEGSDLVTRVWWFDLQQVVFTTSTNLNELLPCDWLIRCWC